MIASFETLTFATGVPTEHDVGADPDAVAAWVRQWSAFDRGAHPGIEVDWVVRVGNSSGSSGSLPACR